jgi:2'-5' RNA ligase
MFERFAIFYTPTGALADLGAAWLGWDSARGQAVPHPAVEGLDLDAVTATPRKYGLHGTLKAPFRLHQNSDAAQLEQAVADIAARLAPVTIAPRIAVDHGFVALRPQGEPADLRDLARALVTGLDTHRAPLTAADIARRRQAPLTARQDQQMLDWGYPYIFDDFHFHLTLSGHLEDASARLVADHAASYFADHLGQKLAIDAITLMGQDKAGMFHQISRAALTG